jgi:hypothetical protein
VPNFVTDKVVGKGDVRIKAAHGAHLDVNAGPGPNRVAQPLALGHSDAHRFFHGCGLYADPEVGPLVKAFFATHLAAK